MEYTGVMTAVLENLLHISSLVSNMASELSIVALAFDRYYAVSDAISGKSQLETMYHCNCDHLGRFALCPVPEITPMSGDEYYEKVTIENVLNVENLVSNQEEADTKIVLHAMDALECEGNVCIRSPSGDTDILVIAVGLLVGNSRVLIDTGNGDGRKKIWL